MEKMRILFVNICEKRAFEGHRLHDSEWINGLAMFGEVDVICPSRNWYQGLDLHARIIPFDAQAVTKGDKFWHSKAVNRGIIRRLDPFVHLSSHNLYRFVEKLDQKRHYAFIFAAHLDPIMFLAHSWCSPITGKLFVLEHTPELYKNRYVRICLERTKNRVHHVTMEKICVPMYVNRYGIDRDKVHAIPHPCNKIPDIKENTDADFAVVGLSNSNSPQKVAQIIAWEKKSGYFRKHHIKAVFRSPDKNQVYDDGWLRVITGRLSLSLDDYYSYIKNAAVLVLPFDENFGARTSGTIIDALSNKKCCIGTAFPTMKGYAREYRAVCRVYRTITELEKALAEILGKNSGQKAVEEDFNSFEKDRSMDSMKVYMEKAFMGYI